MAVVTKHGIVHATKSGIVRRIIIPDDDSELQDGRHVGPGESMLQVPRHELPEHPLHHCPSLPLARALVAAAIGFTSPSSRCAVVDAAGDVVNLLHADPDIDSVPGYRLILSETANLGWKLDANGSLFDPSAPR